MDWYGRSSFFRDESETLTETNALQDRMMNFGNHDVNELRMIPSDMVRTALTEPAWSRFGYPITDEAKSAYESSSDLETRRKAGLGISMRFPASRSALWDSQPEGLPTHLTHALCIPSILFPPDLIASIRKYVEENRLDGEWEMIGRLVTVDHQLSCKDSTTRSNSQIVFERFQRMDAFRSGHILKDSQNEIRAHFSYFQTRNCDGLESYPAKKRAFTTIPEQLAHERIFEQLKNRHLLEPEQRLIFAIGCTIQNESLCLAAEVQAPCESYVVTPLKLLKIIPTVLAQNLFDRDPSVQNFSTGFLTLDQTRRLLVLKEEDPKASQLPLVGIWISGVESFHSSSVWAALLRYRNCHGLGERVTQKGGFLLLCYQRSAIMQPPVLAQVSEYNFLFLVLS
jgi:hypothetical protein